MSKYTTFCAGGQRQKHLNQKRDSQQRKRVCSLKHHVWNEQQGGITQMQQTYQSTDPNAESDGSAQSQQYGKANSDNSQLLLQDSPARKLRMTVANCSAACTSMSAEAAGMAM